MQITTSAVCNSWKAEGVTSADDLACLYTRPRQVLGERQKHIPATAVAIGMPSMRVLCWQHEAALLNILTLSMASPFLAANPDRTLVAGSIGIRRIHLPVHLILFHIIPTLGGNCSGCSSSLFIDYADHNLSSPQFVEGRRMTSVYILVCLYTKPCQVQNCLEELRVQL